MTPSHFEPGKIAVGVAMHCDLKPSNSLLDEARLPVIADLGSARGLRAGMAQRVGMSPVSPPMFFHSDSCCSNC
jgi:serine/threonine protein kinase